MPWDGQVRANISTLAALPYCADWALSKSTSVWFDDNFNNSLPLDLLRSVNNVLNLDRIYFSTCNFNRWDITWNLLKTLRHLNRYGLSFSSFYSFTIKCINNILPTGDNLAKRHAQIYNNWTCLFCDNAPETLQYLLTCTALTQNWIQITHLIYNNLRQVLIRLRIRHELPQNLDYFLPPITDNPNSTFLPPIRLLAIGIFPTYILADLHGMGIRNNIRTVGVSLLKHSIAAFREHIWISRCNLNIDREKHLGITAQVKRSPMASNISNSNGRLTSNVSGQYQLLLERWKRNWKLGLSEMDSFVKKGYHGFNNS